MSITVKSLDELYDALAKAKGGETILLEGGDYGAFGLNKWLSPQTKFPSTVTLQSADPDNPAVFSQFAVSDVTNLTVDGVVFDYTFTQGDALFYRPFQVNSSTPTARTKRAM